MEIVDVLRVANKLRTLAQDYDNRPVIVRRGVLPSLITFLNNDTIEIRIIASETLSLLSSHPDNKQIMSAEPNLINSVCTQFKATTSAQEGQKEAVLRSNVSDILSNLIDYLSEEQMQQAGLSLKEVLKTLRTKEQQLEQTKQIKKHNLIIEVDELRKGEAARQALQKVILQAKGTISYTISVADRRVNLYTRTSTEKILGLFSEKGFTCNVVQDVICETEYRKPTAKKNTEEDKENREPKYLSPEKKKQDLAYKNSLVSHGDSYEARLAQARAKKDKKEKEQESGGVSRFLTKITSLFW
jgi:hypothetical protein